MIEKIVINQQFCGPPGSGNGGYVCGRMAHYIEGPATIRLMKPPPLDTPLDVSATENEIQLVHEQELVARAWAGGPEIEIPPAPDLEDARHRTSLFAGHSYHAFPGCFVCGTERSKGDGLLIYPGPPQNASEMPPSVTNHVACTWVAHEAFCGPDGKVLPEFCWATLDCPSGWSFLSSGEEVALLGEFSAEIQADLECGQEYMVAGWEIARKGRKRLTGSAIYDTAGTPLAWASATWITIDLPAS